MTKAWEIHEAREGLTVLILAGLVTIWVIALIALNLPQGPWILLGQWQPHILFWLLFFFVLYFTGTFVCCAFAQAGLALALFLTKSEKISPC